MCKLKFAVDVRRILPKWLLVFGPAFRFLLALVTILLHRCGRIVFDTSQQRHVNRLTRWAWWSGTMPMPKKPRAADPKIETLRLQGCLNPHPENVTDPVFHGSDFFEARDLVQLKYEMLRTSLAPARLPARPPTRPRPSWPRSSDPKTRPGNAPGVQVQVAFRQLSRFDFPTRRFEPNVPARVDLALRAEPIACNYSYTFAPSSMSAK